MLKKILKNSSYLLGAQSIAKVVAFFYTLFLAHSLGVSNFGLYIAALAYFSLLGSIVEFGFNGYLIRESAKDHKLLPKLTGLTIFLRIIIAAISFVSLSIFISLFDKDSSRADLSLLAMIAILPQAISITFDAALTSMEKLKYSALGILGLNFATSLLGVYFITQGNGRYGAIYALLIGQIIYSVIMLLFVYLNGVKTFTRFNFEDVKKMVIGSLPYGFLAILGLLYFKVDTLILSYIKGSEQTGIYGAAYRFLEAMVFVPSAISSALFPVFARMNDGHPQELYKLYKKALLTMFLISIPVALSFVIVLPILIRSYLPNYIQSISVLSILALTIPFMFMISPSALLLFSHRRYLKPLVYISLFNLFLNICLNLIFIPYYGYIASAWITLFSDIVGFTIFYAFIRFIFSKS